MSFWRHHTPLQVQLLRSSKPINNIEVSSLKCLYIRCERPPRIDVDFHVSSCKQFKHPPVRLYIYVTALGTHSCFNNIVSLQIQCRFD